jgi:hypothetical protein
MYDGCTVIRTVNTENGRIEIVDSACKEGLPHTTDANTIRMTESVYADKRRKTTLIHERIHLDQKRNPILWSEFYRRHWEYELKSTPPKGIPEKYIQQLRPNPDTESNPWAVWRNRWVFFPVYGPDRSLRKATVIVWDTETERIVSPPPEWRAIFCDSNNCPRQFEHPHELAAEYSAEGSTSPASLKLFDWKHLEKNV